MRNKSERKPVQGKSFRHVRVTSATSRILECILVYIYHFEEELNLDENLLTLCALPLGPFAVYF